MSEEEGAVPGPSGLESLDSSHSGTHPRLAPENIQHIAGVVAGMLRGSSASLLSLPPTSSTTTTASLMATDTTVSHASIILIITYIAVTPSYLIVILVHALTMYL